VDSAVRQVQLAERYHFPTPNCNASLGDHYDMFSVRSCKTM